MTRATKPVRRIVRQTTQHGVREDIVVSTYPNGSIGLREHGRALRTEQKLDIGVLYQYAIVEAVRRVEQKVKKYVKAGATRAEARKRARGEEGL